MIHDVQTPDEATEAMKADECVLYFTASWCGPCRQLKPVLDQVSADFPSVTVVKIDVDTLPDLAPSWNVRGVPTLLALSSGVEVARSVGSVSASKLEELFQQLTF